MARRTFTRDARGRFAPTSGGKRRSGRTVSRRRVAAIGAGVALGALYVIDGKGTYRLAGAALAAGSGAYGAVQLRRRRRR